MLGSFSSPKENDFLQLSTSEKMISQDLTLQIRGQAPVPSVRETNSG
jgi:hypothetical protein